jgi:hypothetical protein
MATAITCGQTYEVTPTEVNGIAIDGNGVLRQGEIFTGTPTITATGMTASSPAVMTSSQVVNGQNVEPGKGITFTLTGGTDGTDYNIKVSCGTSLSRTREIYCLIRVRVPTASAP